MKQITVLMKTIPRLNRSLIFDILFAYMEVGLIKDILRLNRNWIDDSSYGH